MTEYALTCDIIRDFCEDAIRCGKVPTDTQISRAVGDYKIAWNTRAERTCKSTTNDSAWCFVCSECGKSFPRDKLHLAHNHGEINYCPNCGARVVS